MQGKERRAGESSPVPNRASKERGCEQEGPVGTMIIFLKFTEPLSTEEFREIFWPDQLYTEKSS